MGWMWTWASAGQQRVFGWRSGESAALVEAKDSALTRGRTGRGLRELVGRLQVRGAVGRGQAGGLLAGGLLAGRDGRARRAGRPGRKGQIGGLLRTWQKVGRRDCGNNLVGGQCLVETLVDAEVATLGESLATVQVGTDVGSLARVLPSVDLQGAGATEGAPTLGTAERSEEWPRDLPLVGVPPPVVLQVSPCDEAARAARVSALVWSLAGMGPHVGLQVPLFAECLLAPRLKAAERPLSGLGGLL